jgi:putative transposase
VAKKRIARLMARAGIRGVCRRRSWRTTRRNDRARPAPDLVQREFTAARPNQLWVADITYVPTCEGSVYLAVVLDVFSRKVVGWALETTLRTELVLGALEVALARRQPRGVIHHSDQGSQYTSIVFGERCRAQGIRLSMGSVGDAYDNAVAEAFFASLECELLDRMSFQTRCQAKSEIFDWIERWYNPHRRHSALGQRSPVEFEHLEGAPSAGGSRRAR